jgi:mono/diheme cytochrome c family protein
MKLSGHRVAKDASLWVSLAVLLAVGTLAAAGDSASNNDKGKAAFKANCIACHGSNGAGTPLGKSIQAPDLRSQEIQKKSDAELSQTIADGKNNMPSFKRTLNPEQVQAVITYVRELGKNNQSPRE